MRVIDILKVFNEKADVRRFSIFVLIQILFTIVGNLLVLKDNTSTLMYGLTTACVLLITFVVYAFTSGYTIIMMQNILNEKVTLPDWLGNIKNIFKLGFKLGFATLIQLLLIVVVSLVLFVVLAHYLIKNPLQMYLLTDVLILFYFLLFFIFDLLNSINIARTNSFKSCFTITIFKNETVKYFWYFVLVIIISLVAIIASNFLALLFAQTTILLRIIYLILTCIIIMFLAFAMFRFIAFKHLQVISKNEIVEASQEENQEENKGE